MAIDKATLAKEIDGEIVYVYPKTTADMVEYTPKLTVKDAIDILTSVYDEIELKADKYRVIKTNTNTSGGFYSLSIKGIDGFHPRMHVEEKVTNGMILCVSGISDIDHDFPLITVLDSKSNVLFRYPEPGTKFMAYKSKLVFIDYPGATKVIVNGLDTNPCSIKILEEKTDIDEIEERLNDQIEKEQRDVDRLTTNLNALADKEQKDVDKLTTDLNALATKEQKDVDKLTTDLNSLATKEQKDIDKVTKDISDLATKEQKDVDKLTSDLGDLAAKEQRDYDYLNTKVIPIEQHYTPVTDTNEALSANASNASAAWSIDVVKGITINRDSKGHVTGIGIASGKIPANPHTVTLGTTTKAYILGTTTTPTSTASVMKAIADTGVYLDTAAGRLHAESFEGDGSKITGLTIDNISDGILPIVRGGTGANTAPQALTNLNAMSRTNPTGTGSFSLNRKIDTAIGDNSFTEGQLNTASGFGSHAEGHYNVASGLYSHAEGENTKAEGMLSHSEGEFTIASGNYQHVQGRYNIKDTENKYAFIIGNGESDSSRNNALTVDWNGNLTLSGGFVGNGASLTNLNASNLSSGTLSAARLPASGVTAGSAGPTADVTGNNGTTVAIPRLTVDTYGRVTSLSSYNLTNVNTTGSDTKVNVTLNKTTKAYLLGTSTTPTSTATGVTAIADTGVYLDTSSGGLVSSMLTTNLVRSGSIDVGDDDGYKPGYITFMTGSGYPIKLATDPAIDSATVKLPSDDGTLALKEYTMSNINPTGTGYFSLNRKADTKIGDYSFAAGSDTTASGDYSVAIGLCNTASGDNSAAFGRFTTASGNGSFAFGEQAEASGECSVAGGSSTASEYYSFAIGMNNTASGSWAYAEGRMTTASGSWGAHSEGNETIASGQTSHAEGAHTVASGVWSHAEGEVTKANGDGSHAEGQCTIASGDYQHVQGKYNIEDKNNKYAFIIGNGSDSDNRSNAFTVDWDGNVEITGTIKANGKEIGSLGGSISVSKGTLIIS